MELLSGHPENEAIRISYDDPFLSNEAKNSLLEKNKQKSEKTVRISDGPHDHNGSNFSIRSEIDDIKRILKSLNGRYSDQLPSGGYTRNFRQNFPNCDDFDSRYRYPRNDFRDRVPKTYNPNHYRQQTNHIQQRGANWF